MSSAIDNSQDVIDSRDVIERIEELTNERQDLLDAIEVANQAHANGVHQDVVDAHTALVKWDEDNGDELKALEALAEEASDYAADWKHGEALIRDSYFQEYAQQLAEGIGAISPDVRWPNNCIDWEQAAHELQQDYTSVNFDNVIYWIR